MTILNWLYWKKQQLIKTKANNAKTDLIVLGAEVPFTKRDDGYQDYAMSLANATQAGCTQNNTLETGIFDIYPYIVTPGILKSYTNVVDAATGDALEGWKVEGTILLDGSASYSEYLGTITIKNYTDLSNTGLNWKASGTVQYTTPLPNIIGFEPLGLFNSANIGGSGDYAQYQFATFPTVVGNDLLIDIELYVGPAPFTLAVGTLESIVSFQIESLLPAGLEVTYSI
jgi:hypothetical protein